MDIQFDRHDASAQRRGFSRREFLAFSSAAACSAVISLPARMENTSPPRAPYTGKLCLFSKALPEMGWRRLAQSAKRVGFTGIDLTVRKGGHVAPERAAEDLPKAVATIREEGLEVPMITTALTSATDPAARVILSTAGKLSITYCKTGYYYYDFIDVRHELDRVKREFPRLVELAKECGVQLGYHNHDEYVGAPVWDMATVIEPLDPKWVGYYFDPRHAVAEGGVAAWKIALNLVTPRLKMVAVKDFYWEKTSKGWQAVNCPLGEGMVDWKYFFRVIAQTNFQGPTSLHLEYDVPGSTPAAKEETILLAAQRDLEFIKAHLREAYGAIGEGKGSAS